MTPPDPTLRLRLDTGALSDNWRNLDRLSGSARAGAAVKADAYGLGIAKVVPALHSAGCSDFFVAHWSEALAISELVDPVTVSVLHGPLRANDAVFARELGVKPVINSLRQAKHWVEAGGGPCDLMVDTGINRLGVPMADLGDPLLARLSVDVLLSHLASADEDSSMNASQQRRWMEARRQIGHSRASLANSAGITLGEEYHGDLTRPGIALYGGVPCAALDGAIRQVAYPEAAILQARTVKCGDSVGYNATFTATSDMRVGVLSLGYADGYLRSWSGRGVMKHGDRLLPVVGRVSMDMTIIDLSDAPDLGEGAWVDVCYNLPDAAAKSGLSQYELLTGLGRRFQR